MALEIPHNPHQRSEVERIEKAIITNPDTFFAEERDRIFTDIRRRQLKRLFDSQPENETLARMWEIDPAIMSELMPEVGTDAFEVPVVPKWRVLAGIALNNLRLCVDKGPKETRSPEKRIRDAWQDFQDPDYEGADEDTKSSVIFGLIWEDAIKTARKQRDQELRNHLLYGR